MTLPFMVLRLIDLADYVFETVTAPPVAADWVHLPMPMQRGDSWGGDVLSDGQRLYLVSRENVQGFWGVTRVRSSSDGGMTWSPPGAASLDLASNTARPTIALGPDGAVWVAFARQGPQVATQYLQIGRSADLGATWPELVRASPPSIGLVGLPALLMTPDVRLVAYTDGATGAAIVQPLAPDGQPEGAYSVLGTTTRELYSDAQFLDAGFTLAAAGRHVVALWHSSDRRLEVGISDDRGRTWRTVAPLSTQAAWARPQLFVSGSRFVALTDQTNGATLHSWLELDISSDGGMTWERDPALTNGLIALEGVVSQAGGSWTLAYAACSGWLVCTVDPRIWYRSSVDGQHWTDPQPLTRPGSYFVVGVGMTAGRAWAIWEHDLSASDEDRTIEGVIR